MALKDWDDIPYIAGDCVRDFNEWNDMVAYIRHSTCTDFTIYSTCPNTGQAFKFSQAGALSQLYGGADTGDDLAIYANSYDLCATIKLYGNGDIISKVKSDSEFKVSTCSDVALLVVSPTALTYKGTNICLDPCGGSASCPSLADLPFTLYDNCSAKTGVGFQFAIAGVLSTLEGGNDSGDDFLLKANSSNDCSFTKWFGNEGITHAIKATSIYKVSTCSDEALFEIDSAAGNHHMHFHCLDACDFVLENRTTNPSSPTCTGQIWFRTDLV